MGPNSKKMSRKQYVKYRLRVLRELYIAPPPPEKIVFCVLDPFDKLIVSALSPP